MPSFDPTLVNLYLVAVFTLATIALVVSIGVATTEVVRHGRLRGTVTSPCGPTRQLAGRRPSWGDRGSERA